MLEFFHGPLLHAGGVDPTGWLWSDWNIEATIVIGLLALVAGYLFLIRTAATADPAHYPSETPSPPTPSPVEPGDGALLDLRGILPYPQARGIDADKATRPATSGQKASFIAGAVVLFVALGPPLDDWSDHYLLLAHMVQHLLLVMLAAPLLLYGTPEWVLEPLTRNRVTNTIGYWLTRPLIAYAVANTVFVLWHVPMFYEMALRSQPVHVFEHATMLTTALLAWWPTLGPLPRWPRLALPLHSLYYFAMTLPGTAVGAFITFADPGLYAPYDTAERIFGIDLATDQQAAGLLMWVALGAIYLLLITYSFFRWASREESADREAAAQARTTVATSASISGDQGAQAMS